MIEVLVSTGRLSCILEIVSVKDANQLYGVADTGLIEIRSLETSR